MLLNVNSASSHMTVTVTDNIQNDNRSCSFGLASSKLGFHFRCRGSSKIYLTNQLQKKKKNVTLCQTGRAYSTLSACYKNGRSDNEELLIHFFLGNTQTNQARSSRWWILCTAHPEQRECCSGLIAAVGCYMRLMKLWSAAYPAPVWLPWLQLKWNPVWHWLTPTWYVSLP